MQVNFRYSDTDFVAYLMTLGYEYNQLEIVRDKNKQLKAFIYFKGDKDELINIQDNYRIGNSNANISSFTINRKKITKIIKSELLRYQANQLGTEYGKKQEE